jgi:hypothetical protein
MNLIATLGVVLLLAGSVPARGAASPSIYRLFESDKRLARTVQLPRLTRDKSMTVGEVVEELSRQLGVELMVQGPLFRQPVSIEFQGRTGRDILAAIALKLDARWEERKGVYLLKRMTLLERSLMEQARAEDEPRVQRALVDSLSQWQRGQLTEKRRLTFEQLNPQQRQLFLKALQWAAPDFSGQIPSAVMTGQGAEIRLTPIFDGDNPAADRPYSWEVHLVVPMRAPDGMTYPQPFAMLSPEMSVVLVGNPRG